MQAQRHAGRKTGRQTDWQGNRQADRQADRQSDRKTSREAGSKTGRQKGKETGRQRDRKKNGEWLASRQRMMMADLEGNCSEFRIHFFSTSSSKRRKILKSFDPMPTTLTSGSPNTKIPSIFFSLEKPVKSFAIPL